jgi:hypothetical protein
MAPPAKGVPPERGHHAVTLGHGCRGNGGSGAADAVEFTATRRAEVLVGARHLVFDHTMAAPYYKGPRTQFNIRWSDDVRRLARARAAAAGLTVNDYLTELVKRDDVDARGRPVWAPDVDRVDQLPMELTA